MSTADTIRFICTGCGYRARIPANYNGKVILCPKCQQMQIATADGGAATGDTVRVSKLETAKGPTNQVSVPDAEGRIRFTCVGCAYQAKLAATYAGKAIACPKCQAPNLVPPLAPDGGGGPSGNGEAPSAQRPAAQAEDDGITFDLGDAKPAPGAGAETVDDVSFGAPAAQQTAGAETVDDVSFAAAARPGEETVDDSSFSSEAQKPAAPARPGAKPGGAGRPAAKPQPPAGGKPKTGVVRRGAKPVDPAPADEDEGEDEDDSEEPAMPRTPNPLVEKLKQPPVMAAAIAGGVLLILTITFLALWLGASGEARRQRDASESASARAEELKTKLGKAEWATNETADKLGKMTAEREKAAADLKAAKLALDEAEAKFKKADGERADEYAKRKKAEDDHDALFKKLKEVEAKREEDYQARVALKKALDEETKLRRELKEKLDEQLAKPR
jgi:hypothetical protein